MHGMYIKVGRRVINTAQITDTEEFPPEAPGEEKALVIHMVGGRTIALGAEDAERFLEALPVYAPVEEGEE